MNLRIKLSLVFICLMTLISCNKKRHFTELLKSVDTVKIQRFVGKDTLSLYVTDKRGIDIFKNIINGKRESISTNLKSGRILFYSEGKLILDVEQYNEVVEYSFNEVKY